MPIFGALRIKNESRWIERVIRSIQPACDRIFVFDDHSTDETPDICERLGATVYRSEFSGLNESRDKDWLLQRMFDAVPKEDQHWTKGNPDCPYWVLAIDGDEELVAADAEPLKKLALKRGAHAWALKILYLWNSPQTWRTDGVYGRFYRPSLFRMMNRIFRYQVTPWGGGANLHCSSIPQELLGCSRQADCRLLHWGYIDAELRKRKFIWYSQVDPDNEAEDRYRHMIQGDIPEIPAEARLKHAGPLRLEPLP